MRTLGLFAISLAIGVMNVASASAQNYPDKPINIVVGFPPGGNSDVSSRLAANSMSEQFNQRIMVENRPGASTSIAARYVSRSAPDGYTLFAGDASPAIITLLQADTGFKWDDLELVGLLYTSPWILLTSPGFPAKTLAELVAYAKANPGKITWADQGPGAVQSLVSQRFIKTAGIEVTVVPYSGSAPAQLDVMEGRVDVTMEALGSTMDRIKSGRFKALAISGEQRYSGLPDQPTFKESGVDMIQTAWIGFYAPKGTPKDVLEKVNKAIGVATDSTRYQEWLTKAGGSTGKPSVAEAKKIYEDDRVIWRDIVTTLGLTAK
jgi:tripartite-type tricarboxylate transporter receptor subunit TctC